MFRPISLFLTLETIAGKDFTLFVPVITTLPDRNSKIVALGFLILITSPGKLLFSSTSAGVFCFFLGNVFLNWIYHFFSPFLGIF